MIDLAALGYIRLDGGSWHRPGTESGFGYNDGDDAENHVAWAVREADDVSALSTDLRAGIRDWPSLYHLSSQRGNVIAPFLGHLTGPVLEIGAGMGAITRALGESGLEVVAVEGSPRRAAVCADRCRDLPNVQVVADTVQGFGQPRRFGTVVVIGVLEYARVFGFETDRDPIDVMLEHVAGLLEPDGQLILAIENQLGLKYLAGFPEDHTGRRMDGVEDRYQPDTVVTFGRKELGRRLAAAGLAEQEWFYSFPDYKLPRLVLADATARTDGAVDPVPLLSGIAAADHQHPGTTAFDADRVWDVVHRNGLLPDLANSFIVRASAQPQAPLTPLAWHFGGEARRPEFVKTVAFTPSPDGVVVRRSSRLPAEERRAGDLALVLADEPYVRERPWSLELARITRKPGWNQESVTAWFDVWLTLFRRAMLPDAIAVTTATPVPPEALDALPRNLLAQAGTFIDLEWVPDRPLDLGHVAFRALWDSLAQLGPVAPPAPGTPLRIHDLIEATLEAVGLRQESAELERHYTRETDLQKQVTNAPALAPRPDHLYLERRIDAVLAREATLTAEIETRGTELDRLRAREATLTAEIETRGTELDRLRDSEATLTAEIETRGAELDRLRDINVAQSGVIDGLNARVVRAEAGRAEAEAGRAEAEAGRAEAEAGRAEAEAALAARPLSPYRRARSFASRVRHRLKRELRMMAGGRTTTSTAPEPRSVLEAGFDAAYYRATNADLAGLTDIELWHHFIHHGRAEGRRAESPLADAVILGEVTGDRSVIILLLHEATRTGAPVLGWNLARELERHHQVVVVVQHEGELVEDLADVATAVVVLDQVYRWRRGDCEQVVRQLTERYRPVFVVANSTATAPLAPLFEEAGAPVVALIHEFASSMRIDFDLKEFFATVSEVVFPAPIVAESMKSQYVAALAREPQILPQGPSRVPPRGGHDAPRVTPLGNDSVLLDLPEQDAAAFLGRLDPSAVLVLGIGTLIPRKGVEFFAQAAARSKAGGPTMAFAWVGHRVPKEQRFVDELLEQVRRSGIEDRITFLAPTTDLDALYRRADLFFLSSRLDPLPNVTIDAALAGVPVVAFQRASGFAEWMLTIPGLDRLVVPYLDTAAASEVLVHLAGDHAKRSALGETLRAAAEHAFDMPAYADRLVTLGEAARRAWEQERTDVAEIVASGRFDTELYSGGRPEDPEPLIRQYVHLSRITAPRRRPRTGVVHRRPLAGFHPLRYAEQAPHYVEERDGDPFAAFLRHGEPEGEWISPVLRPANPPGSEPVANAGATGLRVLVHGHFHYPDLLRELLTALDRNTQPVDLHLTATSSDGAAALRATLDEYGRTDDVVEVVPNVGRDLGPLVTGLGRAALTPYELVLHVHGKRSVHADDGVGDRWRTFLWENLVGGKHPMLDVVCRAFAEDPALGLVFPTDPHLNDWDLNREEGERLAARLGIPAPLPQHFDFPMGGMFWARTAALEPLLAAGLAWEDYPAEPLPIDGTMLHALERLIPFVVEHAGYTIAKTAVPGVTR